MLFITYHTRPCKMTKAVAHIQYHIQKKGRILLLNVVPPHPERHEGSFADAKKVNRILRAAQDDSGDSG